MSGEHTIGRWLEDRRRNTPNRVAIDFAGRELTYEELAARSAGVAGALLDRGVARGDRIATLTANSPDHVATLFACARLGLALQPLNWRLAPDEVRYQLDDADPALLVVEPAHAELARQAGGDVPRVAFAELDADRPVPPVDVSDDDPLLLSYTSGTTGKPKGAVLTHANCFWTNLSFDRTSGIADGDVVLQVLPQFHSGGWNVQALLAWWKGATVVLEPSFDPARALGLIEEKRVTTMMGVPATYLFMAEQPEFASADLSSLRLAVVGGAPMPESLLRTWHERGIEIVQGYGLTEAAPNVLCLPPEDATRKLGFAGTPYPHVDVALRDPETGSSSKARRPASSSCAARTSSRAIGQPGGDRGGVRGRLAPHRRSRPAGRRGLLPHRREAQGARHLRRREHLSRGDRGRSARPRGGGRGCGHRHTRRALGRGVRRVRRPSPARRCRCDELLEWCRGRLARYKVPREIRFVDALPRSAMNKVLKQELRSARAPEAVR